MAEEPILEAQDARGAKSPLGRRRSTRGRTTSPACRGMDLPPPRGHRAHHACLPLCAVAPPGAEAQERRALHQPSGRGRHHPGSEPAFRRRHAMRRPSARQPSRITDATLDDLEGLFGRQVAELVDGVTKLTNIAVDSLSGAAGADHAQDVRRDGRTSGSSSSSWWTACTTCARMAAILRTVVSSRPTRRWRFTRPWRTAWASAPSNGSSRTSLLLPGAGKFRRSRAWFPKAARSARRTSTRYHRHAARRDDSRQHQGAPHRGARSTCTPSTRR